MTASSVTPVTLLTGFLGSGKTTLLNRLLKQPAMSDTAVLINEFGPVPIDHMLVREASGNVMVMSNGCICCSIAGDMVTTLRDLYFKRANGEVPDFRRVIIETTGLADPAPIMHTLIEMPLVAARYSFSGIVTTVDAVHAGGQLDEYIEAVKQVAVADRIVITKMDSVTDDALAALKSRLAALNPGALLFAAVAGDIDAGRLLDTGLFRAGQKSPDVRRWMQAEAYRQVSFSGSPWQPMPTQSPSRHDDAIRSFSINFPDPVVWQNLVDALEMLAVLHGNQLLRVKGIVNIAGEAQPRAIHIVQHTLYPAARLPGWPDADHRTRLVFIVRGLDEVRVRDTLAAFVDKPAARATGSASVTP